MLQVYKNINSVNPITKFQNEPLHNVVVHTRGSIKAPRRSKTALGNKRVSAAAVAERLYPYHCAKKKTKGGNSTLSATNFSDVAEKEHIQWINYPSSVADLQKSAHIVLDSQ